uniref:Uncharacterized protein n=1 Tax=Arundo donax TaxID=35708 RepID=A0A0A9GWZ4_ARUDO
MKRKVPFKANSVRLCSSKNRLYAPSNLICLGFVFYGNCKLANQQFILFHLNIILIIEAMGLQGLCECAQWSMNDWMQSESRSSKIACRLPHFFLQLFRASFLIFY